MLVSMGRFAVFVLVFLVIGIAVRVLFVDPRKPDETELQAAPKPLPPAALPSDLPPPPEPTGAEDVDPLFLPKQPHVLDLDPDLDRSSEPPDCEPSSATVPTIPVPAENGQAPHGSN